MDILPKKTQDFAKQDYWNEFYTKRKDSFEWYGTYQDLRPLFTSYMQTNENLLVLGSGTSNLCVDLYNEGFQNNTAIDISENAIKIMKEKFETKSLRFEVMDMFKMTFEDKSFDNIIDKGTLDAVSSSEENDLEKLFSEIDRVLRYSGRYYCVSLLQERVLVKLLSWFSNTNSYIIRIHRCKIECDKNQTTDRVNFPVFLVVCVKCQGIRPRPISVDMNQNFIYEEFQLDEVFNVIKLSQTMEFIKYSVRNNMINDEDFYIELFGDTKEKDNDEPRYKLYFVYKTELTIAKNKRYPDGSCTVFLVPPGCEHEWMYATSKGRKKLLEQCKWERMIVVHISRKYNNPDKKVIQMELQDKIKDFFPPKCGIIQFVTNCPEFSRREILWEGDSNINGKMFVEKVTVKQKSFRRLIFGQNPNIVQSEVMLKSLRNNNKSSKSKQIIDHSYLSFSHHAIIVAGLAIINKPYKECYSLLMIGLGGGCFVNYLARNMNQSTSKLKITIVEIDPVIEEVATKFFEFKKLSKSNLTIEVIIEDGLKYIAKIATLGEEKFDFVIFDVDSKDLSLGLSCPPKPFVEEECLRNVLALLNNDGFFILNLVARDEDIKKEIYLKLKNLFNHIIYSDLEEDLNEIIFASNVNQIQWLQVKDRRRQLKAIKESCFYIPILDKTHEYKHLLNFKSFNL